MFNPKKKGEEGIVSPQKKELKIIRIQSTKEISSSTLNQEKLNMLLNQLKEKKNKKEILSSPKFMIPKYRNCKEACKTCKINFLNSLLKENTKELISTL